MGTYENFYLNRIKQLQEENKRLRQIISEAPDIALPSVDLEKIRRENEQLRRGVEQTKKEVNDYADEAQSIADKYTPTVEISRTPQPGFEGLYSVGERVPANPELRAKKEFEKKIPINKYKKYHDFM